MVRKEIEERKKRISRDRKLRWTPESNRLALEAMGITDHGLEAEPKPPRLKERVELDEKPVCNLSGAHSDFENICSDFLRTRNDEGGLSLYHKFVELNELDPRISYRENQKLRMLKHPIHLKLKEEYPGIDWDRGIVGVTRKKPRTIIEIDLEDLHFIDSINGYKVVIT